MRIVLKLESYDTTMTRWDISFNYWAVKFNCQWTSTKRIQRLTFCAV